MKPLSGVWLKPWDFRETDPEYRTWYFPVRIFTMVMLLVSVSGILRLSTRLSSESYQKPVIYLAFLEKILMNWQWLILSIAIFTGAFFLRKNLRCSWGVFPHSRFVRLLVMLATVVLAWTFATYDLNLFLNRAHYTDRLLLSVLIPLIYWRPVFVLPFLTMLFPVVWQFGLLKGFSWATILIPLNVLILFSAFYIFYVISKKFLLKDFAFLSGCLFAAHYWLSGYGKLTVDWLMRDQIYFLLPATYTNGWLDGLNPDTISFMVRYLAVFNIPLKLLVITIEFGMLFFFFRNKWTRFLICGAILLHAGIFLVSGIFFWMWGIMGIGLLICFTQKEAFAQLPLNSTRHIVTSMILIAGGIYWCNPPNLVWYDSPVSYTYRFKAIAENADTYYLPPAFFAPYDYQFTLGKFSYLSHRPSLQITWGDTQDADMAQKLSRLSLPQALSFEARHGAIRYDSTETMAFDRFLTEYIHNWNVRLSKDTWLSKVSAPRQLWTFPNAPAFEKPMRIDSVVITRVTSFFSNNNYSETPEIPIRKIKIPS